MKKIYVIVFTVFLNTAFLSCTPESYVEEAIEVEACCGDSGDIPPPPPPPPGGGG
ncbi:hypothetical protein [Muriicola sp. Z0-33]|uniref:hypothetical protein n=1 Tax=Muriicola sp. Z0-33 TaxID=2816957 RepID=UPI002237A829|nr:hypothetical protein [Muriicola sp. Z0-33]MCW5516915.1 hypothetical protein [Muriicola sp. Z0-33]